MRADLHVHTTASDGAWSPEQVVLGAAEGGLDLIAIADHDSAAGVARATAQAATTGVRILPAVELSTTKNGRELHVLAYKVDVSAPELRKHEERAQGARLARMEVMVGRLQKAGLLVDMESVLAAGGETPAAVGRPHLARALVASGQVGSIDEAFDRYLADGLPAFEPTAFLDPVGAVQLARACGGMAVWAHPPMDMIDAVLPELVRAGLRGIEVYRPLSTSEQIKRSESLAKSAGLFTTGGSDWHSLERNGPLGSFYVNEDRVGRFLEAALA
jgi:predicted metal-dependent phosphoesterase TrpH